MNPLRIICVGGAGITQLRRSEPDHVETLPGGPVALAALTLAQAGHHATLHTALADTAEGQWLREALDAAGVNVIGSVSDIPAIRYHVEVGPGGEVVPMPGGRLHTLQREEAQLDAADWTGSAAVICDTSCSPSLLRLASQKARQHGLWSMLLASAPSQTRRLKEHNESGWSIAVMSRREYERLGSPDDTTSTLGASRLLLGGESSGLEYIDPAAGMRGGVYAPTSGVGADFNGVISAAAGVLVALATDANPLSSGK